MSTRMEFLLRTVSIGIGATIVMDLYAVVLKRSFGVPRLDYRMLGRWIGHFPRGQFVHRSIADAPSVPGELLVGWAAHYTIGVTFAGMLLALWGLDWARHPTLLPALTIGILTVLAPFFIMQPGMGAGIAASRTPKPGLARLRSLATHTVYGLGLYGAARLSALLIRS